MAFDYITPQEPQFESERYGAMPGQYFPIKITTNGTIKVGSDNYTGDDFYVAPASVVTEFVSGNMHRDFFNEYMQLHVDERHEIGDNIVFTIKPTYINPSGATSTFTPTSYTFTVGTGVAATA